MNLSLAYTCCMDGLLKLWSRFGFVWRSPKTSIAAETLNYVFILGSKLVPNQHRFSTPASQLALKMSGSEVQERLGWGYLVRTSIGRGWKSSILRFWGVSFLRCLLKCSAPAADVDNDQLVWCLWWVFEINFVHNLKSTRPCLLNAGRTHLSLFIMPSNTLACPTTRGSACHLCTNYILNILLQSTPPSVGTQNIPKLYLLRMWFPISTRTIVSCTAEWPVRHPVVVPTFMSPFQISALPLGVQPAVEFLFTQLPRDQKIVSIYMSVTCLIFSTKNLTKYIVIICASVGINCNVASVFDEYMFPSLRGVA